MRLLEKEKRKRAQHTPYVRREKEKQICPDLVAHLQVSGRRLKRGWIGTKLGELVPHLEYFDLLSWFEDWLSLAPDLRAGLSVGAAAVSAQSSFGR